MEKSNIKKIIIPLIAVIALAIWFIIPHKGKNTTPKYYYNKGFVFGTYYNIRYQATQDFEQEIKARFEQFDNSLSMFNPHSVISVLNQGRDTVWDEDFSRMYETAQEINAVSNGAFDITVAPLVNAWGFGFKNKETITPERIDSLKHIHNVLDASAIAKGQSCDVIAQLLEKHHVYNYLVDIGGEVVAQGRNDKGEKWRIGINKPIDDSTGTNQEIQTVISSYHIAMATSGNYRNFYYEGEQKRSHTIDPRTGYPVQHDLLSATVVASTCMRADALATACMVLGTDSAKSMIEKINDAECYLIVADGQDYRIVRSSGWKNIEN